MFHIEPWGSITTSTPTRCREGMCVCVCVCVCFWPWSCLEGPLSYYPQDLCAFQQELGPIGNLGWIQSVIVHASTTHFLHLQHHLPNFKLAQMLYKGLPRWPEVVLGAYLYGKRKERFHFVSFFNVFVQFMLILQCVFLLLISSPSTCLSSKLASLLWSLALPSSSQLCLVVGIAVPFPLLISLMDTIALHTERGKIWSL